MLCIECEKGYINGVEVYNKYEALVDDDGLFEGLEVEVKTGEVCDYQVPKECPECGVVYALVDEYLMKIANSIDEVKFKDLKVIDVE